MIINVCDYPHLADCSIIQKRKVGGSGRSDFGKDPILVISIVV